MPRGNLRSFDCYDRAQSALPGVVRARSYFSLLFAHYLPCRFIVPFIYCKYSGLQGLRGRQQPVPLLLRVHSQIKREIVECKLSLMFPNSITYPFQRHFTIHHTLLSTPNITYCYPISHFQTIIFHSNILHYFL